MSVYIEEQVIYAYSVMVFHVEPLAPCNHTKHHGAFVSSLAECVLNI